MGVTKPHESKVYSAKTEAPKLACEIPSGDLDVFFQISDISVPEPRKIQPIDTSIFKKLGSSAGSGIGPEIFAELKSGTSTPVSQRPRASSKEAPQISALPKTEVVTPWDFVPLDDTQDLWRFGTSLDTPSSSKIVRDNVPQVTIRKISQLSITTRPDSLAATPIRRRESWFTQTPSKSPPSALLESPLVIKDGRQSIPNGVGSAKEDKLKKCIRVYDASDNSVTIDVSALKDGKAMRERIIYKIIRSQSEIQHYRIMIRNKKDSDLDDSQLLEICSNIGHPDRSNLQIRRVPKEEDLVLLSPASTAGPFSPSVLTPLSAGMHMHSMQKSFGQNSKDEKIRRCIRITDMNSNSFWIDISYANDSNAVREKVGLKLGHSTNLEIPLLVRQDTEDVLITDQLLMEICSNPEHPLRTSIIADMNKISDPNQVAIRRARTLSCSSNLKFSNDFVLKRTSTYVNHTAASSPLSKTEADSEQIFDEKLKVKQCKLRNASEFLIQRKTVSLLMSLR
jgi:hypothetical protein